MSSPVRPLQILIIDDEKGIRTTLALCLETMGCKVEAVASSEQAMHLVSRRNFDLAFLDLKLGHESGLELLPRLLAERPTLAVVLITAFATFDTAVEAIRRGAFHYLPKPFTPAQIRHVVEQLEQRRQLEHARTSLQNRLGQEVPELNLETDSPRMQMLLAMLQRAAASDIPVLLRGENGTGKGALAAQIHQWSPRRDRPFVVVNCPTLSDELLASELFGHAKGAFTGAIKERPGRVEAAQGGTLFLDEIGEIPPSLQARLLRFLQDHQFERVGENHTRVADVRIVAATNRDLEADVAQGRFRQDLYFRLNVVEALVPPLRERPEDIQSLAHGFLSFFARQAARPGMSMAPETEQALQRYPWPGNVRELRNALERAVILWPGALLLPQALPERIVAHAHPSLRLGGDHTLEEIEREHIQRIVARTSTLEEAARILGIEPSTLWRKRKKYEES